MLTRCAEPISTAAELHAGLGGQSCRLTSDTAAGSEALARWFGRYRAFGTRTAAREIRLGLQDPDRPELRIRDAARCYDFSDLAAGPEWRRFVPVPHPCRLLLADTLLGADPVLELVPHATRVLQPRLWPLYTSLAWQWLLLRDRSLCCLHAAVSAYAGQVLVLVGGSGTGKSTLSRALQLAGAEYFGDDGAYFSLPGYHLYPLPRDLCLRPGGLDLLNAPPEAGTWHTLKPGDPKYVVRLAPPARPCPSGPVHLLFLDGFAERPELLPVSGVEATRALFSQLAYGSPAVAERLAVTSGLASRSPCRRLRIGPPQETAALLLGYLERA